MVEEEYIRTSFFWMASLCYFNQAILSHLHWPTWSSQRPGLRCYECWPGQREDLQLGTGGELTDPKRDCTRGFGRGPELRNQLKAR